MSSYITQRPSLWGTSKRFTQSADLGSACSEGTGDFYVAPKTCLEARSSNSPSPKSKPAVWILGFWIWDFWFLILDSGLGFGVWIGGGAVHFRMTRAEYSLSGYLNLCDNVWWNHFCPSICYHSYLCTSRGHCLGLSVLHVLHITVEYRWSEFITKWFLFADRPHAWLLGLRSTNQIHFEFRRYEPTAHAISDLCIIVEINVLHNIYISLEQCLRWRHLPLESDPDGTQV